MPELDYGLIELAFFRPIRARLLALSKSGDSPFDGLPDDPFLVVFPACCLTGVVLLLLGDVVAAGFAAYLFYMTLVTSLGASIITSC